MVPGGGTVGLQMDISFVSTPLIEQILVGGNCTVDHGSCADDVLLFGVSDNCKPPNMVRLGPFSYLAKYMVRYDLLVRFKLVFLLSDLLL